MKYWWVNHNKTWKHEVGGGYIWSPQLDASGKTQYHWENMRRVNKGDIKNPRGGVRGIIANKKDY